MGKIIKPQPGPQEKFLATPADIAIYGGSAGGGKSYALLMSPLRYKDVKDFRCTIFRKNYLQVFSQGGLWDTSTSVYGGIKGAVPKFGDGKWVFYGADGEAKAEVKFAHIEHKRDLPSWQGSQIAAIFFDELTHFSEEIFFYMLSRNRSICGVKPFVRATCNPDADSWVASFIEWWIDQDTGYPIPERSGKVRYFIRRESEIFWADTREELWMTFGLVTPEEKAEPKSVTFIMSSIYDNKELLKNDPGYLANLKALSTVEKERLLNGNWKIKPASGLYFSRAKVGNFLASVPPNVIRWCRCWDLAATTASGKNDPDWTVGALVGKTDTGRFVVADIVRVRTDSDTVRRLIVATAQRDTARYKHISIRLPQDPGQAGKDQAIGYVKMLSGYNVRAVRESGNKVTRAEPFAAQWQAGNVDVVVADWNEAYLMEMENFPEGAHDDVVDASANAFAEIETSRRVNLRVLTS